MNRYFHVTRNYLLKKGSTIKPEVPISTAPGEDETIPRFCVADTIEGCLTSVIWGLYEIKKGDTFRILEVDLDSYDKENIAYPDELVEKDLVCDAEICGETWIINTDVKIINHRDVIVTEIEMDVCPYEGCESYDIISYIDFEEINIEKEMIIAR